MSVDRSYIGENKTSRERIRGLVTRLSDSEAARPLGDGWTVAAVLAHPAFWDQITLHMLERWKQDGYNPVALEVPVVNEALRILCLLIPPQSAGQLSIATAEAIDRALEELPESLVAELLASGRERTLHRSLHRNEHLDQLERALGRIAAGG